MLFMSGSTVVYAAVLTIGVTILVAALKKATRMKPKAIVDALAEGAKQTVSVAIACACVGIVVGVSPKTGFGLTMPTPSSVWGIPASCSPWCSP